MKKILFLSFLFLTNFSHADPTEDSLTKINQEIERLENQIYRYQVQEANTDIHSQDYMFGQPGKYSEEIKRVDSLDRQVEALQIRLNDLKKEHDRLHNELHTAPQ